MCRQKIETFFAFLKLNAEIAILIKYGENFAEFLKHFFKNMDNFILSIWHEIL